MKKIPSQSPDDTYQNPIYCLIAIKFVFISAQSFRVSLKNEQ